jgi:hypothetical protein
MTQPPSGTASASNAAGLRVHALPRYLQHQLRALLLLLPVQLQQALLLVVAHTVHIGQHASNPIPA